MSAFDVTVATAAANTGTITGYTPLLSCYTVTVTSKKLLMFNDLITVPTTGTSTTYLFLLYCYCATFRVG